jgi:hypothetical protein
MSALTLVLRRPVYGTGKKVAFTDTAGSVSLPAETRTVIIWCSEDAYVAVGKTATTADMPLPAGVVAQVPVDNRTGGPITVSAIQDATGGNMFCIAAAE